MEVKENISKGDFIGWSIAIPTLIIGINFSLFSSRIDNFREIYSSLGVELPKITQLLLSLGSSGIFAIGVLISISPIIVLVKIKNDKVKIAAAIMSAMFMTIYCQLVFTGMFNPLFKLGEKLSNG